MSLCLRRRCRSFPASSLVTCHNARALVTSALTDWGLLALQDDALICAGELVANSQRHALHPVVGAVEDRQISVGMRCWDSAALFIEISDHDPQMPKPADPPGPSGSTDDVSGLAESGIGMFIVGALADELWWERTEDGGKVVTCRFDLERYGLGNRTCHVG